MYYGNYDNKDKEEKYGYFSNNKFPISYGIPIKTPSEKKPLLKIDFEFKKLEEKLSLSPNKQRKSLDQRIIKQLKNAQDQKVEQDIKPVEFMFLRAQEIPDEITYMYNVCMKYCIEKSTILSQNLAIKKSKNLDNDNLNSDDVGVEVGVSFCQGLRPSMEDQHLVKKIFIEIDKISYPMNVFAIFDGHNGATAAMYAKNNFIDYFTTAMHANNPDTLTDEGVWKALKASYLMLNLHYRGNGGTTATMAITIGGKKGKIWFANAGDSRAILSNIDSEVIQMTSDHKPSNPKDLKKIEKLGGKVKAGRICNDEGQPVLNVSRGVIADKILNEHEQCLVSAEPKITYYPMDKANFVTLACDGVWDIATSQGVGRAVIKMSKKGYGVDYIAKNLVYSAINEMGSTDNVTAMTLQFRKF